MNQKGTLYIISAASGTGKTSLAQALSQSIENIKISISHTTRKKRDNEQNNYHYFFVSVEEFNNLIKKQAFLEYACIFGNYYGTSRSSVEQQLQAGYDVVLDIDWQGARQIRFGMNNCVSIFLLPPSLESLRFRLENRKSDNKKVIHERLLAASSEISHYKEFDYIIVNDNFEDALIDLQSIVRSHRLQLNNQIYKRFNLIKELEKDIE